MQLNNLARLGYATKGIVYSIIGILAIQAAFTVGGKTTDSSGALYTIAAQPFGQLLLSLVAIGLIAYTLWRLIQAIFDPEHLKTDSKRIAARIGYFLSGLIYGGLAIEAIRLVTDAQSNGGGRSTSDWTTMVLKQPFGRWLVAVGGAITIGVGLYRIYRAYKVKFRQKLDLSSLNHPQKTWAIRISRFGIAARGVVFIIIGFFFIQAARQYNPNQAKGLDGALQSLAQQPYGKFLLGLVAFGLLAYGIYQEIQARYRRFPNLKSS